MLNLISSYISLLLITKFSSDVMNGIIARKVDDLFMKYGIPRANTSQFNAFRYSLTRMALVIKESNIDDAYYAAVKMLDVLYDTNILSNENKHTLLSGEDKRVLLLNAILTLENGDYTTTVALAERGMFFESAANFYFLKSIALSRLDNLQEAVAFNEVWQKYVRSEDNVVDTRCLYLIAQTNFTAGAMFMQDMQIVISNNQWYLPAYETLRRMMHSKGLILETEEEARELVDEFNSLDGDLTNAWSQSSLDAKRALVKAIINYPYDND